jgi:ribosomal protein S18 acetylase RimI-like enzyme
MEHVAPNLIRPAEPMDYERIISVTNVWWNRDVAAGLPRLFLDHFWTTSLVAESPVGVTGFLVGFHSPSEADTAYVHYVATSPTVRRSGLARHLYDQFFDDARHAGRSVVRAITSASNTGSIAFHRAMGFTVSEPIPDYNGPGRPAVKFELMLT